MPSSPAPDLLIFDLDGTLIDSRQDLTDALNRARAHFGLPSLDVAQVSGYVGDGVRRLVERGMATTDPNVVEAALAVFRPYYAEHCLDHTRFYPDVPDVLDALAGRTLAVLTNKPEAPTRRILQGLGVAALFSPVIGGDSGPERKPDPAGVREVLRRTAMTPDRAIVIGDSLNDLHAARGAGVRACLVTYGIGAEADLRAAGPDLLLRRLGELPAALGLAGTRVEGRRHP